MFKVIKDLSLFLLKHPTKRYNFRDTSTIDRIVVHQTATEDNGQFTAYNIASFHVNTNDWAGIGYHYLITDDGTIYQTNPDNVSSYHASGYNTRSLGVAITGDHDLGDEISTKKYNALVYLLAKLCNKYNLSSSAIVGHNETGSPKQCPSLDMDKLRSEVKKKEYTSISERVCSISA
tara:strand:+ start:895 stop:1425 length:531 start_codon:yes stop_codon:yes gene_type:complete